MYFIDYSNTLSHHGIKGMKWGVRKEPDKVFISGSSKTQTSDSPYYRKKLPRPIRRKLRREMRNKSEFLVGDAPGIDRQVQDYLHKKGYNKVTIYSPGTQTRYKAGEKWVNKFFNDTSHEPGSKEWLAKKDIAMTKDSTKGLAVILDEGANATRNNVTRLRGMGKPVEVYELSKNGKRKDKWSKF